jgi:hypothetical protein
VNLTVLGKRPRCCGAGEKQRSNNKGADQRQTGLRAERVAECNVFIRRENLPPPRHPSKGNQRLIDCFWRIFGN